MLLLLLPMFLSGCAGGSRVDNLAAEYYNLGNSYFNQEKYSQAAVFYERALELDVELHKARFNLSLSLIRLNRADEAEILLLKLLAEDPTNIRVFEMLAYNYHIQGRTEDAIELLEDILEKSPESVSARYNLGILLWDIDKKNMAVAAFTTLLDYAPDDSRTLFNLGRLFFELNKAEDAVSYLEEYLQTEPTDVSAFMLLARSHYVLKRYDKALEAYDLALSFEQDLAEAWFQRAVILLTEVEDPEQGLQSLSLALEAGFKDMEMIAGLLDFTNLLERNRVTDLLKSKNLVPDSNRE